jgi:hypothetical protein
VIESPSMIRKRPTVRNPLTIEQSDLAVSFYDEACDYPKKTFEQITKRVVPRGFGKSKTSEAFRKEARKTFDLAH